MKEIARLRLEEVLEVSVLALLIVFGGCIPLAFLEKILLFPVTLLRIGLDVYVIAYLLRRFLRRRTVPAFTRLFLLFMAVLAIWLVYGCVSAFVSPYTETYTSVAHMMNLFQAICVVYCIYECCRSLRRVKLFLRVLGICCGALILLALAESFTGVHMSGSQLSNPGTYFNGVRELPAGLYLPTLFVSTAMEYNCNDLAAILTILLPALFITGEESLGGKILRLVLILLGLYVMIINDSNVTIVGLFASVIVYAIVYRRGWKWNLGMLAGSGALSLGLAAVITNLLLNVKKRLWQPLHGVLTNDFFNTGALLQDTTLTDPGAVQVGEGSLSIRIDICRDMWDMARGTHFLGGGPLCMGWFDTHPARTPYVNPHCWYLEVLAEYGVVVFLSYFGSTIYMYVQMIRAYLQNHETVFAQVIAMCTAFVFACIAPSSFLRFTCAWTLPALCIVLLRLNAADGISEGIQEL